MKLTIYRKDDDLEERLSFVSSPFALNQMLVSMSDDKSDIYICRLIEKDDVKLIVKELTEWLEKRP